MHLIFGFGLDGHPHPSHPGPELGIVGAAAVGPAGMLDILVARLGLGSRPVAAVERTVAWLVKLELAAESAPRFWTASLGVAPWACARKLLAMRDELVEAGWSGRSHIASPRLTDLRAAEESGAPLPRGRADMMREVVDALRRRSLSDMALIEFVDEWADLPPRWRRLLDDLRETGVEVRPWRRSSVARPDNDLCRLCAHLDNPVPVDLVGDGSFVMLRSPQALVAAGGLTDWLAADNGGEQAVVIAEEGDTHLLDRALRQRGLPTLGLSPRDRHRGVLAVLPLAFETMLAPRDPQAALDLLRLPVLPIAGWAARVLARALLRQPAFVGGAWTEAWEVIGTRLSSELGQSEARTKLADWRAWFDGGAHERTASVTWQDAIWFCQLIAGWAAAADCGGDDSIFAALTAAARGLENALVALDRPEIGLDFMRSMIDAALGDGVSDPMIRAEAGPLRVVSNPAGLWGRTGTLVWFMSASRTDARPTAWRIAERQALAAEGVALDDPHGRARRAEAAWVRAVANVRTRLLIVMPLADRGQALAVHSFAQRLAPLLEANAEGVGFDLDTLGAAPHARIAGRDLERRPVLPLALPEARTHWAAPPRLVRRAAERIESASSLSDLVSCQLRWALRHVLGLRPREEFALPDTERLVGDLAHALARLVIPIGIRLDPTAIMADAASRFDEALSMAAAPLAGPGCAAERAFARRALPGSLARLACLLSDAGYIVEAVEAWHEGVLDGVAVRSRLDLVLRGDRGELAVVDLKWTMSDALRRAEVETGAAFQLATYSRLLGPDVAAAYYLLRSQRFLAAAPMPVVAERLNPLRSIDETWSALTADWAMLASRLAAGEVVAHGVQGADDRGPPLASTPCLKVCRFCGFDAVCRVDGQGLPR